MTESLMAKFKFDGMDFIGFDDAEMFMDKTNGYNKRKLCIEIGKELNKFKEKLKRVCESEWNTSADTKARIKKFKIDKIQEAKGKNINNYEGEFPDIFLEDEFGVRIGFKVDLNKATKDNKYLLIPIVNQNTKQKLPVLTTLKKQDKIYL